MNGKQIEMFNKLADMLCDELNSKKMCWECPFHQEDDYHECEHRISGRMKQVLLGKWRKYEQNKL